MTGVFEKLPENAVGLQLGRINRKSELILCEAMRFAIGRPAVHTVLRRAQIAGRVEIGGEIVNHLADVLDSDGNMIETVALDAASYKALKTKWMRCKVER